jgi:Flp pilus assembly protein TadG
VNRRTGGQAIVEFALVSPLLLLAVVGIVALGLVGRTDGAVSAVASEAARAAALASSPSAAIAAGQARAAAVAQGYRLGQVSVNVDTRAFRRGGQVVATADYTLVLNLPMLDATVKTVPFHRVDVEPIAPNRSFWP